MIPYKAPEYGLNAFNCPHCGAFSQQQWVALYESEVEDFYDPVEGIEIARCAHCSQYSVWREERMVYPTGGSAPLPNPGLPQDVKDDYEEARSIASLSPRGAAALLRLSIQKLCKHLGESGENINTEIANLVKRGLSPKVQKALDIVRVIGNNAVHPGQIDLKDDAATVEKLFGLVNLIAEVMITQPKHVDALYEGLPESQRKAIDKRDGGA